MADAALFIGFGQPARARERQALALLEEFNAFFADAQQKEQIESFEPVLLQAHGGDLGAFLLVRGGREQIDRLAQQEPFQRMAARGSLVLDGFGVVPAHVGQGLRAQLEIYASEVEEQLASG